MRNNPIISVVMPVYNGSKYLKESIASVLQQTFKNFEFIIINDGSTDNSLEIIESFQDERIEVVDQKNQGVAASLNNGINIAKGKYIARMDADDISLEDRFKTQFNFLNDNPDVIVVGSNADVIDKDGNFVYTTNLSLNNSSLKNKLSLNTPFIHPSVMIRFVFLKNKYRYYDIPLIEDLLFFRQISAFGEFANIKEPLIKYRISPSATSRRSKKTIQELKKTIEYFTEFGKIEDNHIERIKQSMSKIGKDEKYYQYHLLLAKKYLWNNYQPTSSRKNISMGLKYKKSWMTLYFLYFLSYFPRNIIRAIYQGFKRA